MSPEGRRLLADRRSRLRRMRRRVVATSFTTFAVAWAVIFFQMVSGHDPALTRNGQAHAKVAAKSSAHKKSSSQSSASSSQSSSSGDSSSSSSGESPYDASGSSIDDGSGYYSQPQSQTQTQSQSQPQAQTPAPVTTSQS